ncbi:MAG: preprotein translocase subunit SecE [Bdellovibrionaceae bacterium]|nr:preprotein translocase subunit SecE [Pseudobdellovibrionaceae bacterium]
MDKTNSKVLTMSFAIFGVLCAVTLHLLIKAFGSAFGVIARLSDSDLVRHGLPVAFGLIIFLVLQFSPKVLAWGDEVVSEIRKVVWPSRKDVTAMTIVVCVMVLISSVIVTSFDFMSGYMVTMLTK